MRARQWAAYGRCAYVGFDVYPYQFCMGFSLRWFDQRPHVRIYLGPLKFYAGGHVD